MHDASALIAALRASHDRLAGVLAPLSAEQIRGRAYPSEWSIAQVVSHLGSGAQIMALSVDATLTGSAAPGREANGPIWDTWNAKTPDAQVADGVEADRALVERFESLDAGQLADLRFQSFMGVVDAGTLARLRLAEHCVHTWDVAVVADPAATIGAEAVPFVLPGLGVVAGFSAKSEGLAARVRVTTTDPAESFVLTLGEKVSIAAGDAAAGDAEAELTLPAEAFIRLVYGRLDPDHTPASVTVSGIDLDALRRTFPGF